MRHPLRFSWIAFALLIFGVTGAQEPSETSSPELPQGFVQAVDFLRTHGLPDIGGRRFVTAKVKHLNAPIPGWLLADTNRLLGLDAVEYKVVRVEHDEDLDRVVQSAKGTSDYRRHQNLEARLMAALLYQAGKLELAKTVYGTAPDPEGTSAFTMLLQAYSSSRFVQAMDLYAACEDERALMLARELLRDREVYEREIASRGDKQGESPFRSLDALPDLVKETERRLGQKKKPALDIEALKKLPQPERIAKLIEHLEHVGERAQIQPNWVMPDQNQVLALLMAEGAAAGDPLLDTIEKDRRLSRSISISRNFYPYRNIIPVSSLAWTAFLGIAQVNNFLPYRQQPTVEDWRKWWKDNKGLSPPERLMRILADDKAGSTAWAAAAERLISPSNVTQIGGWTVTPPPNANKLDLSMKGEPVRGHRNPSVSELMAKRALQLLTEKDDNDASDDDWHYSSSLGMALKLERWDPKAALPALRSTSRHVMKVAKEEKRFDLMVRAGMGFVRVVDARLRLGDRAVLREYADWLLAMPRDSNTTFGVIALAPMVKYRNEPEMSGLASKLFEGDSSAWSIVREARLVHDNRMGDLVASPLLMLPEMVDAVLKALDDPEAVATGSEPRRVKDGVASALSILKGAPEFDIEWPIVKRDPTIAAIAAYVRENRSRLVSLLPNDDWRWEWFGERP